MLYIFEHTQINNNALIMTLDLQLYRLERKIQDRILFFSSLHHKVYLNMELDPWEVFFNHGMYNIFHNIIKDGADLKALFYMKEYIGDDVAIYFACKEKSIQAVKNVCIVWEEARHKPLGYKVSVAEDFYWGIKNLCPRERLLRPHWSDIMVNKQFPKIPVCYNGTCREICDDSIFNIGTIPEWLLKVPTKYHSYMNRWVPAIIGFHNGRKKLFRKRFIHEARKIRHRSFPKDDAVPKMLFNVVSSCRYTKPQLVNDIICLYDKCLEGKHAHQRKRTDVAARIFRIINFFIKKGREDLLPELCRSAYFQPFIKRSMDIITAVKTKNRYALETLLPILNNENGIADVDDTTELTNLYYHILEAYGFMMRQECRANNAHQLRHLANLEKDPNILITRVLHNIQVQDIHQEHYTTSLYHLREMGGHFNDHIISQEISKSLPRRTSIQRRVNLQAIYEVYKSDSSFRLRNKFAFYINKASLDWRCLTWILYRVLKEDILIAINNERSCLPWFSDGRIDIEMCFMYMKSYYMLDLTNVYKPSEKDIMFESVVIAWENLFGLDVPNFAF